MNVTKSLIITNAIDLDRSANIVPNELLSIERSIAAHRVLRILFALCAAPVVTIGLMLLMSFLIDGDFPELVETRPIIVGDIFDTPEETPPVVDTKKDEIDKPVPPPTLERDRTIVDGGLVTEPLNMVVGPVAGFDPALNDSDAPVRLVAVAPNYPGVATRNNIEGHVDIRFDVTKSGTTENLEILAYEPSTIFNRAVLKAVSRWRYQPRLVQGEPVVTKGMMERVSFKMED